MLDKVITKLEKTDSRFWAFILGIIATLLVGSSLYARRRTANKKEILENRARVKAVLARTESDSDSADVLFVEAEELRKAALDLGDQLSVIDERVKDAKKRINSSRNIDALNRL